MYRLIIICMILLLTACGTGTDTDQTSNPPKAEPTNGQANEKSEPGGHGIIAGKMEVNVVSFEPNKAVFEIKNQTERVVELEFTSGQQYDLWITDEAGNEVFHWAEGKMFTQALKTVKVAQAETLTYEVNYPELEPGTYEFKFKVTSKSPIEHTFKETVK
ncbi:BsuPI-related putative proteinase inhibitor [Pseudalkalibacillus decolorationis]|uniref:BsuPI-related putative proteinase inhibitor n=1 Tax=Pseudalkalibacillus decolorationis TaxID=163879 RepID=UPI002149116D|nr:BsuPI-related putative proteinase inhibitor [Pseudalkalibacillus decolorationis]